MERLSRRSIDAESNKERSLLDNPPTYSPRRRGEGVTRAKVLNALQEIPLNRPANLSKIAKSLSISREMVRVHYDQLLLEHELPPLWKGYSVDDPKLASEVKNLKKDNLTPHQIAQNLRVPTTFVKKILKEQRDLETKRREQLLDRIKELRNIHRLSERAISLELNLPQRKVAMYLASLQVKGEVIQLRRSPRSKSELEQIDSQVKSLRDQGLTNKKMAEELKIDIFDVINSVNRLIRKGLVKRRDSSLSLGRLRDPKVIERDRQVKKLLDQGYSCISISRELEIKVELIYKSVRRLRISGQIPPGRTRS